MERELTEQLKKASRFLKGMANPQSIDFLKVAQLAREIDDLVERAAAPPPQEKGD